MIEINFHHWQTCLQLMMLTLTDLRQWEDRVANLASQTNQDTVRQRQDFIEENNEDQKFMLQRIDRSHRT